MINTFSVLLPVNQADYKAEDARPAQLRQCSSATPTSFHPYKTTFYK